MRVKIRPMKEEDKKFIFASWLNNYKDSSAFAKRIRRDTFFKNHHLIIEHIFAKADTKVMIAYPQTDDDSILGYLVFEDSPDGHVVHYTFIKAAFQGLGIAKQLITESGVDYEKCIFTHFTYSMGDILKTHEGPQYDPYRI